MKRVLIAEDDVDQRNLLSMRLKKFSDRFEVVMAADGKEAIDLLAEDPVSLVITDIQMPRMNGLILLAYVNTYHPKTPCFVMTAFGTSRLKAKLPDNLLRFFQKPVDTDDLAAAILAVLDRDGENVDRSGISMENFMGMVEMERCSCRLEVTSAGVSPAELIFNDGVLYDARFGELTGEAAALAILKSLQNDYRMVPIKDFGGSRRIKADIQELLRNVQDSPDPKAC